MPQPSGHLFVGDTCSMLQRLVPFTVQCWAWLGADMILGPFLESRCRVWILCEDASVDLCLLGVGCSRRRLSALFAPFK